MARYEFRVYVDKDPTDGGKAVVVTRDISDIPPDRVAESFRRNGVIVSHTPEGDWVPGERVTRVRWKKL